MKKIFAQLVVVSLFAFSVTGANAQQPTPSPEQAPQLLSMLDQNNDKKIGEDEAQGGLKANFALIDSNGDGGIDLEELTSILKMVAGQQGGAPQEEETAKSESRGPIGGPAGGLSFGKQNMKQLARMQAVSPEDDREFFMVNLIKHRAKAKYADGRETDLTGEQADALYSPIEFLAKIGANVAFVGSVTNQIDNMDPAWDRVAIVLYPSRAKFFEMIGNAAFQKRSEHKDAGLEVSQVMLTEREPWTLPAKAEPVAEEDDAFVLVQLVKYRDKADYVDGSEAEQKRTGKEAMDAFDAATADILAKVGAKPLLKTTVEGVVIGDGRTWDDFRLLQFPSQAAFNEVLENAQDAMRHREAAIEDSYLMQVKAMRVSVED